MRFTACCALSALAVLSACAPNLPQGPTVLALPSQGKDFAVFQQDDMACRYFGQQQTGFVDPRQASAQSAIGSAAIGAVAGAAAGALLGAAAGNAGLGAAAGAGGGLLLGSSIGSNNARATTASLQQRYDIAYTQCMYSKGNSVQAGGPLSSRYGYAAYPAYGYGVGVGVGYGYPYY